MITDHQQYRSRHSPLPTDFRLPPLSQLDLARREDSQPPFLARSGWKRENPSIQINLFI
ncbi:hypothetical protein Scep_015777 [Stephania cephalantha]|uniref:Uncharacterized protein n=1 Tax=Stephania cephalantha TaxID=152367 RepID=A0AAP0J673_9MAGN